MFSVEIHDLIAPDYPKHLLEYMPAISSEYDGVITSVVEVPALEKGEGMAGFVFLWVPACAGMTDGRRE